MTNNNTEINRRNFLKAAAATGITGGIAGCADETDTTQLTENNTQNNNNTTQEPAQEQGLQLDFTWEDIKQAEQEHYHSTTGSSRGLEVADKSRIENADLLDYTEFQDVLLSTVNEIVHDFGEGRDQDSSTANQRASAAVNIILNDVLEENETYQEEGLDIKMMPLTNDGHGYTQVASTHHPLTTVDTNAEAVGQPHERPLEEQRNVEVRDPISRFVDQDFHEVDEMDRSNYHGFPSDIYSKGSESSRHVGFESSVIDNYYEEVIFTEDQEGRQLWLEPVRQAVGTIRMLWDEDYVDEYGLTISSNPSELPDVEEYESFNEYAEQLLDKHIQKYSEKGEFLDAVLTP